MLPPDAILDEAIPATNEPVVATAHPKQGSDQKLSPLSLMFLSAANSVREGKEQA
jgi:hypothetical protein